MYFSHLTEIVFCCVPHHRGARVDPGPVLLHDDARDYVLVRLVERLELLEAVVDDCVCPVGHLFLFIRQIARWLVSIATTHMIQRKPDCALHAACCVLLGIESRTLTPLLVNAATA